MRLIFGDAPGPPNNPTIIMDFKKCLGKFTEIDRYVDIVDKRDDNRILLGPHATPAATWVDVKSRCEALMGKSITSFDQMSITSASKSNSVHGTPAFAAAAESAIGPPA